MFRIGHTPTHQAQFVICICLCFLGISLRAQPVITRDALPEVGDTWSLLKTNITPEPGDAGADELWDLSWIPLPVFKDREQYQWIDPRDTLQEEIAVDSFPNANIALILAYEFSDSLQSITYYNLEDEHLAKLGGQYISETLKYTDPETVSLVGLTHGDTAVVRYQLRRKARYEENYSRRTGTINSFYDGYGTLLLPDITLDGIIRIEQTEIFQDTVQSGFSFIGVTLDTTVRYMWLTENSLFPIAIHETSRRRSQLIIENTGEIVNDFLSGEFYNFWFNDIYDATTGIEFAQLQNMTLWPTLASEFIHVNTGLGRPYSLNIYDISGRNRLSFPHFTDSESISISALSSGHYYVTVDGFKPTRFIKH